MKSTIFALLALTGAAFASPTKRNCATPGTYRCAPDFKSMEVCDFDGGWKRLGYALGLVVNR